MQQKLKISGVDTKHGKMKKFQTAILSKVFSNFLSQKLWLSK